MLYIDKMIEIADKIGMKDSENKAFIGKVVGTVKEISVLVLLVGAGILGINAHLGKK